MNPGSGAESKSLRLFLAEFSLAVLVFAVVSAFCIGAFAASVKTVQDTARLDAAVLAAGNAAETLKASGRPAEAGTILLDENLEPTDEEAFLELRITPMPSLDGLASAGIAVRRPGSGKKIYSVTAAWQMPVRTTEVSNHAE